MVKVPSQFPYRREAWRNLLFPGRVSERTPHPDIERWVPDSHIKLAEALEILGEARVEGWSGTESNAQRYNARPDPPWQWGYLARNDPPKFFTINSAEEKVPASELEAMAWWESIEPTLHAEWEVEKSAYTRWLKCLDLMRNELASAELVAFALSESGQFLPIPPNEWIGKQGIVFLRSGVAEFYPPGSHLSFPVHGPVVFERNAILPSEAAALVPTLPDLDLFPYLAFMVRASKEGPVKSDARVPKKVIETWLTQNWPPSLGKPTSNKIINMATFLRRPDDEKGGNHS